jgi:hypothetical protein
MQKLGKLQLPDDHLFEIEVNDNGDTIIINSEDYTLPLRYQKMMEDCDKIAKETKLKVKAIENKKAVDKGFLNTNEIEILKLTDKAFLRIRTAIDGLLGEGACQKIFGDINYYSMYKDLFDQLEPFFTKIFAEAKTTEEAVIEKYKDDTDEVL